MCLILVAINTVPERPWLLLGNRDEFHARATAAAAAWNDHPEIIGGRDLVAGGSWLAVNRNGRFAAVTNVRTGKQSPAPRSRGELVGGYVAGATAADAYVTDVAARRAEYGPFNLVVGDGGTTMFVSSIDGRPRRLERGVHAFSNGSLEDEWPKMRRLRRGMEAMRQSGKWDDADLLELLADTHQPADLDLPQTGVGLALERTLAPIFIRGEQYGTRASTLAYARADGGLTLVERSFGPAGAPLGERRIETDRA
ncbi:MAG TPA: NRDE family protein [Rudaea sp.]|nr:NRDE family protein [Rudaea sp.]